MVLGTGHCHGGQARESHAEPSAGARLLPSRAGLHSLVTRKPETILGTQTGSQPSALPGASCCPPPRMWPVSRPPSVTTNPCLSLPSCLQGSAQAWGCCSAWYTFPWVFTGCLCLIQQGPPQRPGPAPHLQRPHHPCRLLAEACLSLISLAVRAHFVPVITLSVDSLRRRGLSVCPDLSCSSPRQAWPSKRLQLGLLMVLPWGAGGAVGADAGGGEAWGRPPGPPVQGALSRPRRPPSTSPPSLPALMGGSLVSAPAGLAHRGLRRGGCWKGVQEGGILLAGDYMNDTGSPSLNAQHFQSRGGGHTDLGQHPLVPPPWPSPLRGLPVLASPLRRG